MSDSIENPVINGPFDPPTRHFAFESHGITNRIEQGRRKSEYFIPIPKANRAKGAHEQASLDFEDNEIKENTYINEVRRYVQQWRDGGYLGTTATTLRLLQHWSDPNRENRVLFCQREAAETVIYLTEAAARFNQKKLLDQLAHENADFNEGLQRMALKMATGSGKTVVMAMLIAWHTLNKVATPNDARFCKRFLVVTPGITIRDRLNVLLPSDPGNYYAMRDLVPADMFGNLSHAQIKITNYHTFLPRVTKEGQGMAAAVKDLLLGGSNSDTDPFKETLGDVATRIAREFGFKKGEIVVFNDEAHHCYIDKRGELPEEAFDADVRAEIKAEKENARVWFRGLQALADHIGIKSIYDLSATPFFLSGSGYGQGTVFPWVVSDFSLIDAIESGIVKVPRVPTDDNAKSDEIVFRNLWAQIKDELPKHSKTIATSRSQAPHLPIKLESALKMLYENYKKQYDQWAERNYENETPPVFIVVCNNTTTSKLVFDYIAGYDLDKTDEDGNQYQVPAPGALELFTNVEFDQWLDRPRTLLIDSAQLESGTQLTPEFRKLVGREIGEFKADYAKRYPGRDMESVDDATLLREVMNTVGKPGRLGEGIRCVVSVSMLTEGWDANTVTHILGVRAFGTPLLTEQVVGRGLRRRSYELNEEGMFDAEYAEVFGIPFAFLPASGGTTDPKPKRPPTRVRAVPSRSELEISFPRLLGYRLEMDEPDLTADFTIPQAQMTLSNDSVPTKSTNEDVFGSKVEMSLDDLMGKRPQEVSYHLAHALLDRHYRTPDNRVRPRLFPSVVKIVRQWMDECVTYSGDTYPGLFLLSDLREQALEKLEKAISADEAIQQFMLPIFDDTFPVGSTSLVDFETSRPVMETDMAKSQISHVVCDSDWEKQVAQIIEDNDFVHAYAKNDGLNFYIPYNHNGRSHRFQPDFLVRLKQSDSESPKTLVIEVSGGAKRHHQPELVKEKADTAEVLWCPAVSRNGQWGHWDFLEVSDMQTARSVIEAKLTVLANL
jgi:type III restriction enzyme